MESWRLQDFAPGEGVALGAFLEAFDDRGWMDVEVPGDVHQALLAAGRIPDPFYDRNEDECAWIEEREWWYRTQFSIVSEAAAGVERLLLVFHGLDTFVTIWLNGEELGRHGNMFRKVVYDVTNSIHTHRPNTLALCFDPPHLHVTDKPALAWRPEERSSKRNLMRKAQFGYGWDWGPRLPTVGIWRPVELVRQSYAAIEGVRVTTRLIKGDGQVAIVRVGVEVERFGGETQLDVRINLFAPDGALTAQGQIRLPSDDHGRLTAEKEIRVGEPRLWWTHDLGEPDLYRLQVCLMQDGEELDREERRIGIRTLVLDQSPDPDEPGTRFFRFVLNGVPIFARGANWIPASSFVGGIADDRYEQLLAAAREANMNMLRVWGGGIYEHDAFYEQCDRLGILIWQDFMFACAPYPDEDGGFVDEVRAEVRDQVRRLRSHPCLALWCGNNENQMLHHWMYAHQVEQKPLQGALFYDEIMPGMLRELDPVTPYWPGSPYGGLHPNSMREGDVHDWHVWHGHPVEGMPPERLAEMLECGPSPEDVSFLHYAENMGRFISEFGMHASPVYETLRRCIPADQLHHHSPSMDHHNKDNPKNKGDNLMLTVTGLPHDLEEYIDFSMIAQAEGLKYGIEHFRRRKPHCSGALLWQFNDCWPVLSWSILDYYGFGKAGYFYVRRAFAPVLASFRAVDDGAVELWVTNDMMQDVRDTAVLRFGDFAGGTIWEETVHVEVDPGESRVVWSADGERIAGLPDRYLAVRAQHETFPANRHFFVPIKDLVRPTPEPEIHMSRQGAHALHVEIQAPTYLFYVHLIVSDERTRFSDNYFDLPPGERKTIVVSNEHIALTPTRVQIRWR